MSEIKRVGPEEALRLQREEGYRLLDVRTVEEYDAGHPAGADNLPFMIASAEGPLVENPEFFPVLEANFQKDEKLVLSCRSGQRSLRAAEAMTARGFSQIVDQKAGFGGKKNPFGKIVDPGWEGLGLPVETQGSTGRSYAELGKKT